MSELKAGLELLYRSLGVTTASSLLQRMAQFTFPESERITCPTLCLVSEGEGASPIAATRAFYKALSCPKAFRLFTAQEGADAHIQLNNVHLMINVTCDWLDTLWR